MITTVVILAILTLFLLVGAIPPADGTPSPIFQSPVFAVLLGLLAIGILVRAVRHWRRPAFLLAHLGVVAILAGAFLAFVRGVQGKIVASVGETLPTREAQSEDGGRAIPLGFGLTVPEFHMEYFDPSYDWFEPQADGKDPQFTRRIRQGKDGSLDLGAQRLAREELRERDGRWRDQIPLANGGVLCRAPQMVSDYRADVELTTESGRSKRAVLRVNHPVAFGGWRFYLMSCDEGGTVAHLAARRDPGRLAVIAGIWALFAGVTAMCWRRSAPKAVNHVA